ncbi:tetratricopeptide repeat protein [Streptomyces sp. NPDC050315]|uniref:tetratricopeptide repeat protein n=1 Tax=Streptomyces sp. NPDC050315 TaxID=3155039 RepID=UPI003436C5EC
MSTAPVPTASLRTIRADAFRDAALSDADMHRAAEALEPLRGTPGDRAEVYRMLERLDACAAESAGQPLLPVLNAVRHRVVEVLCDTVTTDVRTALERGPEAGVQEWLQCYAEAMTNFREPVNHHLLDAWLPAAVRHRLRLPDLVRWTDDAYARRWVRSRPLLEYLLDAAQYRPCVQVELLTTAGELALYLQGDRERARHCFDTAVRVGPEEPRAWDGLGQWLQAEGDPDGAEKAYRRAIEACPERNSGHYRLGQLAEEREEFEAAEEHYLRAVETVGCDSEHYRSLIALYGRPELYEHRKGRIERLAAQANAAEPACRYETLVELGRAYATNGELERARRHLRTAVYLRPKAYSARWELADVYRVENDLDRAVRECRWVLRQEPGYWPAVYQLATVCADRQDWDRAIELYEQALTYRPPRLEPYLYGGIAMAHLGAGRHGRADVVALNGLRLFPDSAYLVQTAEEIVERTAETEGEEAAERLLRDVRDIKGKDYEAQYQHSLVRLYWDGPDWDRARAALEQAHALDKDDALYREQLGSLLNRKANRAYEKDRFAEAVDDYRAALEQLPEDDVIHSNLARALEQGMKQGGRRASALREAVAAITRAAELSDDPEYKVRRSKLEWLEDLVRRYGELVATPATGAPVRIAVADDLVPLVNPAEGERGRRFMFEDVPAARDRIREATGFPVHGFRFRGGPTLAPGGFTVSIQEDEVARGTAADPVSLLRQVSAVVRQHAWRLLGYDEAEWWLDDVAPGRLSRDRRGRRMAATRVLRALARDGIPLTPEVVEVLADSPELETAPARTVRQVRTELRATLPGNAATRRVPVPEWLAESGPLPLAPADEHRLATELCDLLDGEDAPDHDGRIAFVASDPELRPWLQRFAEGAIGPGQDRCAGVLDTGEGASDE